MSVLQSVLIKRVNFKENVGAGPRKLSVMTSVRIKRVSVKRGFTVIKKCEREFPLLQLG